MSYTKSVLQPGEQIVAIGRLHWIVYTARLVPDRLHHPSCWRINGGMMSRSSFQRDVFGALAVMSAIHAWFIRWITEIAITDKRVIYKRGFINRRTVETNMDKVATVDVDQSVLGRLLNYGTVTVKGNRSDLRATTARRIAD